MKKLEDVGVLVARILMPILFITAGWGKITGYAGTQQYMEAMGVPGFMLPLVILLEFGGGLAILFGFLTRTTALFTAGFTLLTAFIFHSNFAEGMNSPDVYEKPEHHRWLPAAGYHRSGRIQHRPRTE
jgi:putative oxidoreductase